MYPPALVTLVLAACGGGSIGYVRPDGGPDADSDSEPDADSDLDSDVDTDTDTATGTDTAPSRSLVVTGDYVVGAYGVLSMGDGDHAAYDEMGAADSDPQARVRDGRVFVVGRAGSNVTELDPEDLSLLGQCSVTDGDGAFANPHDVCLAASKVYVLRYELSTIAIVDLDDCSIEGTIDLSAFADEDGIPEMEACIVQDVGDVEYLHVALERLDRDAFYACAGDSTLVVVDTTTDEVVDDLTLAACNPLGEIRHDAEAGLAWIGEVGEYGASGDGGIERIDLVARQSDGLVATEAELGGDVVGFSILADDLGLAIVSTAAFETELVAFDPSDGSVGEVLYAPGGYSLSDVEPATGRWVAVSDRTIDASGLVLVDPRTGDVAGRDPLSTSLPPVDLTRLP